MSHLNLESKKGRIKLADGTVLSLKIAIADARDAGFSPFGGVNIGVKPMGGIGVIEVPKELCDEVADKPLMPGAPPEEGWELVEIVEQEPAVEEQVVDTSKGKFLLRLEAEGVMAARNRKYKTLDGEPLYWLNWTWKVRWKPLKEG
jgi:hypothetical protein